MYYKEHRLIRFINILVSSLIFLSCNQNISTESDPETEQNSDDTFIAVGTNGAILISNDGGISWENSNSITNNLLTSIASNGYGHLVAVGQSGIVVFSRDGGLNWEIGSSGSQNLLTSVTYDGLNRWVTVSGYGHVLYSTDGGDSWIESVSGTTYPLRSIASDNLGNLVAVGGGWAVNETIIYSTNSGTSWTNGIATGIYRPKAVTYSSNAWYLTTGYGYIYISNDTGAIWTQYGIWEPKALLSIKTDLNNNIISVGDRGYILRLSDGLYHNITVNGEMPTFNSVAFGSDRWVVVGESDHILYSSDNGTNWNTSASGTNEYLTAVTSVNIPTDLFNENFEDSDWLGWGDAGGGYTISIVPTVYLNNGNIPQGAYSLSLTGGSNGEMLNDGIYKLFDDITPSTIQFYVRSSEAVSGRYGDFVLRLEDDIGIKFNFQASLDNQPSLRINNTFCGSYIENTWFRIEIRNIDWVQSKFDVFVNGIQQADELDFLYPISSIDRLDLSNYSNSQVWFDDIIISE